MKYLNPEIQWNELLCIGFDLDGTLYDEYDFIKQAYQAVVREWPVNQEAAMDYMLGRWLEKGSSYPRIFDETLESAGIEEARRPELIELALGIFRNLQPQISLSNRIEYMLGKMREQYPLFLFTDGNVSLQSAKIASLELSRFFPAETVFISGAYGSGFSKPGIRILEKMEPLIDGMERRRILYVGDRDRDRLFAADAGFSYCAIQQLFNIIP